MITDRLRRTLIITASVRSTSRHLPCEPRVCLPALDWSDAFSRGHCPRLVSSFASLTQPAKNMLGRRPLVVALSVALAAHGIKLPFALDWLYPGASQGLSAEVVGHKIAVIGAGAGGSSAAWWISKAKARSGVSVQVDVYERENYIGGRESAANVARIGVDHLTGSTVVYPYNDTSLDPIELGASIFVQANKNMWRATQEFNLSRYNFDDEDGAVGFWDGEQFVFTVTQFMSLSLKVLHIQID